MASFDDIIKEEEHIFRADFQRENGKIVMRFLEIPHSPTFNLSVTLREFDFDNNTEVEDDKIEDTLKIVCLDFDESTLDNVPLYQLTKMLQLYMNRFKALQGVELGK